MGTNRSISISLPNNVNFSRTAEGRLASTIHRLNNGPGASTAEKVKACTGEQLSGRTRKGLKSMDRADEYQKEYRKRTSTVRRKLMQKGTDLRQHTEYKEKHSAKSDYCKGQLDPKPSTSSDIDHPYSH